jgi:hypothetical protein
VKAGTKKYFRHPQSNPITIASKSMICLPIAEEGY